jgi:hypothetical protein
VDLFAQFDLFEIRSLVLFLAAIDKYEVKARSDYFGGARPHKTFNNWQNFRRSES